METPSAGRGVISIQDELMDRLGELYRKYPFKMTFAEFLSMVIARMEKKYRDQVSAPSELVTEAKMDQESGAPDPVDEAEVDVVVRLPRAAYDLLADDPWDRAVGDIIWEDFLNPVIGADEK
jgi:hypothetical protein